MLCRVQNSMHLTFTILFSPQIWVTDRRFWASQTVNSFFVLVHSIDKFIIMVTCNWYKRVFVLVRASRSSSHLWDGLLRFACRHRNARWLSVVQLIVCAVHRSLVLAPAAAHRCLRALLLPCSIISGSEIRIDKNPVDASAEGKLVYGTEMWLTDNVYWSTPQDIRVWWDESMSSRLVDDGLLVY